MRDEEDEELELYVCSKDLVISHFTPTFSPAAAFSCPQTHTRLSFFCAVPDLLQLLKGQLCQIAFQFLCSSYHFSSRFMRITKGHLKRLYKEYKLYDYYTKRYQRIEGRG